MSAKVVQFPNIPDTDIAGSLRFLADWAEQNPEEVTKVVVLTTVDDEVFPAAHLYGNIAGKMEAVYILELAKHRILHYSEETDG